MKILVCVEGNPFSEQTVRFGSLVANIFRAAITLMTVIAEGEDAAPGLQLLTVLAAHSVVRVDEMKVRRGTAVHEIIDECQAHDYDMIVLGTRMINGLSLLPSSKVARQVSRKVPLPVLVVKNAADQLKRILICTAGQEQGLSVVRSGAELAALAGAEVCLLYVADPMPQMYSGLETMEETRDELLASGTPVADHLQQAKSFLNDRQVQTKILIRQGLVIEEILAEIDETGYDLVVIGATQHETFWQAMVLGNVSPRIIENASCSVLVVRS